MAFTHLLLTIVPLIVTFFASALKAVLAQDKRYQATAAQKLGLPCLRFKDLRVYLENS